jgi:hypothetical protein
LLVIPEGDLLLSLPRAGSPSQPEAAEFPQKYFKKGDKFSPAKTHHPETTNPPSKHHKLTTKNHPENTTAPTTPLKNGGKRPQKASPPLS